MCFSSIEEKERKKILKKCYWPLLNIIEKFKLPAGIEATGYSLDEINKIDPKFIKKLNYLIKKKYCEFIGSGYSQSIAPLIPSKVNDYNLKIGNNLYKKYFKLKPKIALVNEQVFSPGIIENYLKCGYKSLILDWDNCLKANKKIKKNFFFFPQKVLSSKGKKINVIWSSSIFFQKFQRYAQAEIGLDEYLRFIDNKKINLKDASMCLYASDLEAINFRTKRYKSESKVEKSEWTRVELLIQKLIHKKYKFVKPSEILISKKNNFNFNNIEFNNPAFPCLTKKQDKYNILRWSSTGRNDNKINSRCWKIYNYFMKKKIKDLYKWKTLCYFWSSDFRTHITEKRWKKYLEELNLFEKELNIKLNKFQNSKNKNVEVSLKTENDRIFISNKSIELVLNMKRGCCIEKFIDKRLSNNFLYGFVPHGYYDDIRHGADFYSGHLLIEPLGKHKITDLFSTKNQISHWKNGIIVSSYFTNKFGKFLKEIIFDGKKNRIGIKFDIDLKKNINGSIRTGHITLNPDIFKKDLFYSTNNGGKNTEKYNLKNSNFDHGEAVSHLISANQALGITENIVKLGDNSKNICISIDRNFDTQVGMIASKKVNKKTFFRLYFSVKEHDDTTKDIKNFNSKNLIWISSNKN